MLLAGSRLGRVWNVDSVINYDEGQPQWPSRIGIWNAGHHYLQAFYISLGLQQWIGLGWWYHAHHFFQGGDAGGDFTGTGNSQRHHAGL